MTYERIKWYAGHLISLSLLAFLMKSFSHTSIQLERQGEKDIKEWTDSFVPYTFTYSFNSFTFIDPSHEKKFVSFYSGILHEQLTNVTSSRKLQLIHLQMISILHLDTRLILLKLLSQRREDELHLRDA